MVYCAAIIAIVNPDVAPAFEAMCRPSVEIDTPAPSEADWLDYAEWARELEARRELQEQWLQDERDAAWVEMMASDTRAYWEA